MRVVLASGNRGKLREFAQLLSPLGLTLVAQSELGVEQPEETGDTFAANAILKARHAAAITGLCALADDSGLEVDVLGGAPGVRSARYAGAPADDAANIAKLLAELRARHVVFGPDSTRARFRCVIALVRTSDDPAPQLAQGTWEGYIAAAPRGDGGFGYDPVFVDLASGLTAAELPAEAKNARSHRGLALRALLAAGIK
jgi:XTP/dITP diphosphohydrolase